MVWKRTSETAGGAYEKVETYKVDLGTSSAVLHLCMFSLVAYSIDPKKAQQINLDFKTPQGNDKHKVFSTFERQCEGVSLSGAKV